MTRGVTAGPIGPPLGRIYRVDSSNRIRFLADGFAEHLPWLRAETVERIAVPGARGGITVADPELVEEAISRLVPQNLGDESAGSRSADYLRFLSMRWPLVFGYEAAAKRYSITLPEGARNLSLVPGPEGRVVVFVSGSLFEIWDSNHWLAHLRVGSGFTVGGILDNLE